MSSNTGDRRDTRKVEVSYGLVGAVCIALGRRIESDWQDFAWNRLEGFRELPRHQLVGPFTLQAMRHLAEQSRSIGQGGQIRGALTTAELGAGDGLGMIHRGEQVRHWRLLIDHLATS